MATDTSPPKQQAVLEDFPPLTLPYLQGLLKQLKSGSPVDPAPPAVLNLVSEIVSPVIQDVINTSFLAGQVPPLWKQARVKALLKKTNLDPEDWANYRPISLLPGISKLAEKYANSVLSAFLEENSCLHSTQTGFRSQQGTETALLVVIEETRKILDNGGCAALILLDLSAALDTVNHQLMVQRLRELGVAGPP